MVFSPHSGLFSNPMLRDNQPTSVIGEKILITNAAAWDQTNVHIKVGMYHIFPLL